MSGRAEKRGVRSAIAPGNAPDCVYVHGHCLNDDATAVTRHSVPKELATEQPHWRLTSSLKDADGLDRVRLGDLNPRYLRNPEAQAMVTFAQTLFTEIDGIVPSGEDHFALLWPEVLRLQS